MERVSNKCRYKVYCIIEDLDFGNIVILVVWGIRRGFRDVIVVMYKIFFNKCNKLYFLFCMDLLIV